MLLALLLCLTLPAGPSMVRAQGDPTNTSTTGQGQDSQCSAVQRRQDLQDARLNERDSHLNTRHNGLNTRLNEVDARLNRMDGRFDDLETMMSDMKTYVQRQVAAMGQKVEWGLAGVNPQGQKDQPPTAAPRPYKMPQGCEEALTDGWTRSGVYSIRPDRDTIMDVYCEQRLAGGGWTVFQSRIDGSVDFFQNWLAYQTGFGELTGEFWLGNTNIHRLTKHKDHQLKVELVNKTGVVRYMDYTNFWIGDQADKFRLNVSGFTGAAEEDAFYYNNHEQFSTHDQDNDNNSGSCADQRHGAWWYHDCAFTNLNGQYAGQGTTGMEWRKWQTEPMKATRMMIRKRSQP